MGPFTPQFYDTYFDMLGKENEYDDTDPVVCRKCHEPKELSEMDSEVDGYCIDCINDAVKNAKQLLKSLSVYDYAIVTRILEG